jgi:7-carboxy-7-deazaguanine synthase
MFISEIFHSIQGEGALAGVPSVFIRTSGCNLRCTWCDTKYASWRPEGEELSIDEIVAHVLPYRTHHVVLTGGEPMIAKGFRELANALRAHGLHITIETAGTVQPDGIACDLASLSPKLSNSTPHASEVGEEWRGKHEEARIQPEILRAWIERYPFQLKFVVESGADVAEIECLIRQLDTTIPPWKIFLMPQGTDTETLRRRTETVIELCKQFGYRYCNRLHIELFGHTRGT